MSTTSKLGADMTDEPIAMTTVPLLHYQDLMRKAGELRALLARQPAAIGKEAVTPVRIADAERAAYEVSGHRAGEKWTKAFAEALLAAPLANEASKPAAPLVEQDERGAISEHDAKGLEIIASWMDRDGLIEPAEFLRNLAARAASTSANVAQGAETIYQVRADLRVWIDVDADGYERAQQEDRRIVYAAPPAQSALTDDARNLVTLDRRDLWDHVRGAIHAALNDKIPKDCVVSWAWEEATNRTMDIFQKIVDTDPAAQSASGDTK